MKLNFRICSVLSLGSWWQQPLGKTYDLQSQNGVMVTLLPVGTPRAQKTKCSLSADVDVKWGWRWGELSALWLNGEGQIVNDKKQYTSKHYMKAETEQTLLHYNWNSN